MRSEQLLRKTEIYENLPVNYNQETMFAEEKMQRMSISTTDSEIEDVTSFTVYPSLERHLLSYILDGVILRIIGVASIILLLYALLTVQTHQIGNRSKYDDRIFEVGKQSPNRPHNLEEKLRSVAMTALEAGALNSIAISRIDIVIDNNFEFIVFQADDGGVQKKEIESTSDASDKADTSDPFASGSRDELLFVSDVPPSHSLLLNKFNSLDQHALLVTNEWQAQAVPLSSDDLEAWAWTLDQTSSVGFYNSDRAAGASQTHKHMQIVPMQTIAALRGADAKYALPVEDLVMSRILSGQWRPYLPPLWSASGDATTSFPSSMAPYKIPQFSFQHGLVVLLEPLEWDKKNRKMSPLARLPTYSAYLEVTYRELMASLGIVRAPCPSITSARDLPPTADALGMDMGMGISNEGTARFRKEQEQEEGHLPLSSEKEQPYCHAYNLILTGRWMMAVPRSKARFDKYVAVNGLGFIGLLMGRGSAGLQSIHKSSPLGVLKEVTMPSIES